MTGPPGFIGALFVCAAGSAALIAYSGGGSEGTVVAKAEHGVYAAACRAGGLPPGPVAVPVWGSCAEPECWRLVVRVGNGDTFRPCVSRDEYDHIQLGAFWRKPTDW